MARRFDLEPEESIVREWFAGIPSKGGRVANYGGTLVLTSDRLIWEAIRIDRRFNILGVVGLANLIGSALVETVVKWTLGEGSAIGVPLTAIRSVYPDQKRAGVLHVETDGGVLRLIISAARTPATGNRQARDDAVETIRHAVASPDA